MAPGPRLLSRPLLIGVVALLACASPSLAATWGEWWLPPDYSAHGPDMDWLFNVIFWITMAIFVGVEVALVYFAIKYRYRPDRKKGIFTHGNTRVEMVWTVLPTIVLVWISLATKKVWDEYRFGNVKDEGSRTKVLVIGQQFKWNFIYPGPDGQLGKYLSYPKPSDPQFAHKPADQAVRDVAGAIQLNPLGQRVDSKNSNDPGLDDDYVPQPGRPLIVPVDRPLEIWLGSRDVLHSFFLPNFRVKLDAVPGMRGTIFFTAKKQSTVTAPVESVPDAKIIWVDASTPRAFVYGNPASYQVFDPAIVGDDPNSLDVRALRGKIGIPSNQRPAKQPWLQSLNLTLRRGALNRIQNKLPPEQAKDFKPAEVTKDALDAEIAALRADLKKMGIDQLSYVDQTFEIVCEELCGENHSLMNGQMIVVSGPQYDSFINKKPPGTVTASTTQPAP